MTKTGIAALDDMLPDGIPTGITTVTGGGCRRFAQYLHDSDLAVEKIWKDYTDLDFKSAAQDLKSSIQHDFDGMLFCNGLVGTIAEWVSLLPSLIVRSKHGSILIATERTYRASTYYANLWLKVDSGDDNTSLITIRKNRSSGVNGEQATMTYRKRLVIERVSAWSRFDEMTI